MPEIGDLVRGVAKGVGRTVRFLTRTILGLFVVAALVAGLWLFFRGAPPARELTKPDTMMQQYTSFARSFAGGASQTTPSTTQLEEFLGYFDKPSREWFAENARKMSLPLNIASREDYNAFSEDMHRREAMRFLMTHPAFGGAARIVHQEMNEAARSAVMEFESMSGTCKTDMFIEDGRYKFGHMLGQQAALDKELAGVK